MIILDIMQEALLERMLAMAPEPSERLRQLAETCPYFLDLMRDADDDECRDVLRPLTDMALPDGSATWCPAVVDADLIASQSALRIAKRRGLRRFLWWELGLGGDIEKSTRHLSLWAAGLIESALLTAERLCRFGALAGGRFAVIALGKLGGMELNLGSDVDLLFLWQAPSDAVSAGRRSADASMYYQHLSRLLIRLLSERTTEGECWLTDLRLRPGGDGAPICLSLEATLSHYQEYGQTWERAMLLKARPVAGDHSLGEEFIAGIRPYVFKRYLDFTTVQALAEMKRRIDIQAKGHSIGPGFDVKRGFGGIREVEFVVQSLQLLRGGREPELRVTPTTVAVELLRQAGHLNDEDALVLIDAYWFWRHIEHALQARMGEHTHRLPTDYKDFLEQILRLDDVDVLMRQHAEAVHGLFSGQFAELVKPSEISWLHGNMAQLRPHLEMFDDDGQRRILEELARISAQLRRGLLPERCHGSVDAILADAMLVWAHDTNGVQAVELFAELLKSIAGRATWIDLLATHTDVRQWLIAVLSASRYIAAHVAHNPSWLEWPLEVERGEPRIRHVLDDLGAVDVARLPTEEALADFGRLVDQARLTAAMAVADISPAPAKVVGGWLADTADAAVAIAIAIAKRQLGLPADFPLVALAMGKHGSREMGLVSDLDMVFVLAADDPERLGPKGWNQREWAQRLGRRVIQHLTMAPPFGAGYSFDARLRPSGSSGVLVTTLVGFRDYQLHEAESWEHQALCRARSVAGPAAACQAVTNAVHEVLDQKRDVQQLAHDVVAMRNKMLDHLGSKGSGFINLKQDAGGLVDIEFLAQYAKLAFGGREVGMEGILRSLPEAVPAVWRQQAGFLADTFADYRQMENVLRVQLWSSIGRLPADDATPEWETLRRHAPIRSVASLRERMHSVRGAYQTLLKTE